jgi:epoxyqueuosine reductase QueG
MKEETAFSSWLEQAIRKFAGSAANSLGGAVREPAWGVPLAGFSRGDDQLYRMFKEDIGDFYWTPLEIFEKTFPAVPATAAELTVISWILPQAERIKQDNRNETRYPSERWARSRKFGEEFNARLREHLVALLQGYGYAAVAPVDSPHFSIQESARFGAASTWSERHAAYVSGLGTFGLCDGLITPAGKAMRCGSVIARVTIPPTTRPYDDPHAHCLFYSRGTCGACIRRCPAGAITGQGHDKQRCMEYVYTVTSPYVREEFGFDSYGCGLCQTGVPCESGILAAGNRNELK